MAVEKAKKRETWGSNLQFLLACVGFAVGLGNIWRFPYLCFVSGGGAFLIPYFMMLGLCGIPLLCLEMSVGQLTRVGPVHAIAQLCPICKGVGPAMVVTSFIIASQYNIIMTWSVSYLFHSFQNPLPWKDCDNEWNNNLCSSVFDNSSATRNYTITGNGTTESASLQYFTKSVLQVSDGIDQVGSFVGEVVGFLFLITAIIFCCLSRGVKSVGKVVYFTATFPYVMLFILLGRSVTLPGASGGIYFYLSPDWSKLLNPKIWILAGTQIFNSIGISYGSLIAFSSYSSKTNNVFRYTLIVRLINSATSFLAGFVVFSSLGALAHTLGISVKEAVKSGPELVFVSIPSLFNHFPLPNLWSVLFFLMLLTLGVGSQFGNLEALSTTTMDFLRHKLKFKRLETIVEGTVCLVCCLLGLPHCTQAGMYFFTLVDNYAAVLSIMIVAYFEVLSIWLFGGYRLAREIGLLSGHRLPHLIPFCWKFVTPVVMAGVSLFSISQFSPVGYGGYKLPVWANLLGVFITLCSIIWIPIGAIHEMLSHSGTLVQRLAAAVTPTFKSEKISKINGCVGDQSSPTDELISDHTDDGVSRVPCVLSDETDKNDESKC